LGAFRPFANYDAGGFFNSRKDFANPCPGHRKFAAVSGEQCEDCGGVVAAADYVIWRKWRTLAAETGSGSSSLATAPKPSSALLLVIAFIFFASRPTRPDRRA